MCTKCIISRWIRAWIQLCFLLRLLEGVDSTARYPMSCQVHHKILQGMRFIPYGDPMAGKEGFDGTRDDPIDVESSPSDEPLPRDDNDV